jgi:hypothetical protein
MGIPSDRCLKNPTKGRVCATRRTDPPMAKPRKTGGPRTCFKRTGAPKACFATRKEAERAIPSTTVRLKPYPCAKHGWHLGH